MLQDRIPIVSARSARLLLFVVLIGACRESAVPASDTANAALSGPCAVGASIILQEATFVRSAGAPQAETRAFSGIVGVSSPTLCVDTTHVSSGVLTVNGAELLGPSSFHNANETFTLPFEMLPQNTLAVELGGKPCKSNKPAECATLHVRAVAVPVGTPQPIIVGEFRPINACCSDPTCDRTVFAAAGGVCPGDPRIRGPLPVEASIAEPLAQ